jgi:N,N'-diacetyllegionaminate synthase
MTARTMIIAEAGVNHGGDLNRACEMVAVAAAAGADYVKFQTFVADRLVSATAPKARYQRDATGVGESQHAMIRKLELSRDNHLVLIGECRRHGIGFMSTGFDTGSIDLLIELGVSLLKVPSGEITNLPLLRHVAKAGMSVLMSTGMATLDEVRAALDALELAGLRRGDVTLLHCNTSYPTPMCDANLLAIQTLGDVFGMDVGYSDHTLGIEAPIAAVALGARVIEKHFTLDRSRPGPDHSASLEPGELAAMVRAIRNIESALGDGVKQPMPSELENRDVARRSIVARHAIRAGERLDSTNLDTKRPGTGISPMLWDTIVGRTATRDYAADELIEP